MRPSILLLPALLATAACDGGGGGVTPPPEPVAGEFRAALESPHGQEGSALVELTGGIQSVSGGTGFYAASPIAGGYRVVVVRDEPGTIGFVVKMADGSAPPAARVVEVAGPDDQLRGSLDGYRVTFTALGGR